MRSTSRRPSRTPAPRGRWTRICLSALPEASESLSALLFEMGCQGVEVIVGRGPVGRRGPRRGLRQAEERGKQKKGGAQVPALQGGEVEEEGQRVSLVAYFPASSGGHGGPPLRERLSRLESAATFCVRTFDPHQAVELSISSVAEEDWAHAWKAHYHPFPVGDRFLIHPTWERPPAGSRRIAIALDPGMAFGTGTHPSTQLALMALETYCRRGMRVADVGCGSGILSVAAARLGAELVVAMDCDEQAVEIAAQNAQSNGVAGAVVYIVGCLLEPVGGAFDIVVANITGPAVASLSPAAAEHLVPGGVFIGAGWTKPHHAQVSEAFEEAGLSIVEDIEPGTQDDPDSKSPIPNSESRIPDLREEWCCLVGQACSAGLWPASR